MLSRRKRSVCEFLENLTVPDDEIFYAIFVLDWKKEFFAFLLNWINILE